MNRHEALRHYALLMLCLLAVFAFGLRMLKAEPARPADINSIKAIYNNRDQPDYSLQDVIRFVAHQDPSHLPLYHAALSLWMRYTGRDLFTIRLLSLFSGLLAIAFAYRLARDTSGKSAALDLVWLCSFLAFFAFYAHQARMYALLSLVSLWVLWSYWRLLRAGGAGSRLRWLSFFVSCLAIVYTHYFGFFLLAALAVYHLLFARKNRRWLELCLAMAGAGLLFLPWLPYTLSILRIRDVPASDALSLGESLLAFGSIYANGLTLLPLVAIAGLLMRWQRLKQSERYIIWVTLFVFALLLAANEITALIIARRIRYTIAAGLLLLYMLALGLQFLPRWPLWRIPMMALWLALFVIYWRSDTFYMYTNQLNQRQDSVPHYQDLLYTPAIAPRGSDMILSFHPDQPLNEKKQLDYYGRKAGSWRGLIHIWHDADGSAVVQSTDTRYADLGSMARWNFPIWLIHNPQESDLDAIPAYSQHFAPQFQACGRYLEGASSIIDLYVKRGLPCQLLVDEQPMAIRYDNGSALENIRLMPSGQQLQVAFWWSETIANAYAYSLQLFDAAGGKVAQLDDVIGGDALASGWLDISHLDKGAYRARLIVYDLASGQSQSGTRLADETRFAREVELAALDIGA